MILPGRAPCDEGAIRAAPDTAGCAPRARPWVLAATILGSSLAFIDGSVVSVALPAIQADLAAPVRAAQWVTNAYLLTLGALILVGGASGDRFGRRRVFAWGTVIFTLASIACGLASNAASLIAARAVQGIGAALLVPNSLAIISAAFPETLRGRAIGTWASFSALTTGLGPVLGGWLVDTLSWRAIFFINVPIAITALALAYWRVPESRDEHADAAVDWGGALLASVGLGVVVYGLSTASLQGWMQLPVLGSLLTGLLVLAVFLWHEARAPAPMLPLALFRSRTFSGTNGMTFLLYFALGGALFFLPFNLIAVQGYTATAAGAAFLPFTLIMGLLSRWSGSLLDRLGARVPLTVGPIIAAAGFGLFAIPGIGGPYWTTFFPAMVVLGLGMAISVAPLTATVMSAVATRYAGVASGINNAIARIAAMLAVALLGALAVLVFGAALEARLAELRVPPDIRQALLEEVPKYAEAEVPAQVHGAARALLERVLDESFVSSFRVVMLTAAAVALLAALCAWLTIGRPGPEAGSARATSRPVA